VKQRSFCRYLFGSAAGAGFVSGEFGKAMPALPTRFTAAKMGDFSVAHFHNP
jgi:hypothetical protein